MATVRFLKTYLFQTSYTGGFIDQRETKSIELDFHEDHLSCYFQKQDFLGSSCQVKIVAHQL